MGSLDMELGSLIREYRQSSVNISEDQILYDANSTLEWAKREKVPIPLVASIIRFYNWASDIDETSANLKDSTCRTVNALNINGFIFPDVKRLVNFYHRRSDFPENCIDLSEAACITLEFLHKKGYSLSFVAEREKQLMDEERNYRVAQFADNARDISQNYSGIQRRIKLFREWCSLKIPGHEPHGSLELCDMILGQ